MIHNAKSTRQVVVQTNNGLRLRETPNQSFFSRTCRIYRKTLFWIVLLPFLAITTSQAGSLPDFSGLVEAESDAVVKISVLANTAPTPTNGVPGFDMEQLPEQFRRFFEQLPQNRVPGQGPSERPDQRRGAGFGSGFIISEDGYVITNAHVVNNASEIKVGLHDRREYTAELIGSDTASDIALLKLEASGLPVVTIGDSDDLRVGEWVLAIGSPFGFEHTATQGIVSALARSLPDDTYVPFIQTDVAINPGNSGGPLFNTDGEVVGVNSQIYSRSGGYQGLSFSIPINVAIRIADQLKDKGFATRGWLGVAIQNVDQALAKSFGLNKPMGALVTQVTRNSPADNGGLKSGDIILKFNGKSVNYSSALPPIVGAVRPGKTVDVEVLRNGTSTLLNVTIEPLDEGRQVSLRVKSDPIDESRLGVEVVALDKEQREKMNVESGVVVSKVMANSAAASAGIRQGDIIVSLNREEIDSVAELERLVREAPDNEAIPVLVHRNNAPMFIALTLPTVSG
ncbi:MAG: serine protease Do [Granulosicoccus sp.]|jgi:serine protease Do